MRTMNLIVYEYLTKHSKKSFDQIYDYVKDELFSSWKERFNNLEEVAIDEIKIAELYTMLTVDGHFTRQNDELWTLTENLTYEELKQSKIKVPENIE